MASGMVFVALLRAVNVGGAGLVPMAELRTLVGSLGYKGVVTLIQSGNLVLDAGREGAAKVKSRLERAIASTFDVQTTVILRTHAELDAIVRANPFADRGLEPKRLHVVFLGHIADPSGDRAATDVAKPRRSLSQTALVDITDHHRRALFDAAPRHGEADAGAGRGGNEHGLAFE